MLINSNTPNNKIDSLHYLRGVAVLIVMIHHLFFVYNARWYELQNILKFPNRILQINIPEITGWVFGSFGVAVFFLISGFVIPLTLRKQSPSIFLIRRVFRIYPIAICAVILFVITRYIYTQILHSEFFFTPISLLERLTFIGDLIFFRNVDLFGFWTLQIEWIFYLICAVMFYLKQFRLRNIVIIWLLTLAFSQFGNNPYYAIRLYFISYMFLGTVFYYYYNKEISIKLLVILLIAGCIASNYRSDVKLILPNLLAVLFFAYCVFGVRYNYGIKFLNFFANISYPLYLIHMIVGYHISIILNNTYILDPFLTLLIAVSISVLVSYVLHIIVEKRCNEFGAKWTSKYLHNSKTIEN